MQSGVDHSHQKHKDFFALNDEHDEAEDEKSNTEGKARVDALLLSEVLKRGNLVTELVENCSLSRQNLLCLVHSWKI